MLILNLISHLKFNWLIFLACLLTGACRSSVNQENQSLRIGLANDITTLDRAKASSVTTVSVLSSIYENLLQVEPGTTRIQPAIATEWNFSNDGLLLTLQLRKGVRFHNGKDLLAEDVVYSFNRFLDPNTAAPTRQWLSIIANIEAQSSHTVVIHLKKPDPNVLISLAVLPGIVPAGSNGLAQNPISTGPFRFVRWEHSREIVLERFPEYWGNIPTVTSVSFHILPEEIARLTALRNKEVDILPSTSVSPLLLGKVVQEGYILQEVPTAGIQYLGFDLTRRPYSIKAFRAAIAHCVNREALVEKLLNGHAVSAEGPIPSLFPEHANNITNPSYDVSLAQTLLKEANLQESEKTLDLFYGSEYPWNDQLGEILQSDIEKLGLKVKISKIEWGTFIGNLLSKKYPLFSVDLFAGNGDYRFFLQDLFESKSPLNLFRYNNPAYDKLLLNINNIDNSGNLSTVALAQKTLAEDYPAVFLFAAKQGLLMAPSIQGVRPGVLQEINLVNARKMTVGKAVFAQ
jgi:peptide/nickel transport system substrate-binding protein